MMGRLIVGIVAVVAFGCVAGAERIGDKELLRQIEQQVAHAQTMSELERAAAALREIRTPTLEERKWQVWIRLLHRLDAFLQKELRQYGQEAEHLSPQAEVAAARIQRSLGEDKDVPAEPLKKFILQARQPMKGILITAWLQHPDWNTMPTNSLKEILFDTVRNCPIRATRLELDLIKPAGLLTTEERQQFRKLAYRLPDDPFEALAKRMRLTDEGGRYMLSKELIQISAPPEKKMALWKLCASGRLWWQFAEKLAQDKSISVPRLMKEARENRGRLAYFFWLALGYRTVENDLSSHPLDRKTLEEIVHGLCVVMQTSQEGDVRYEAYRLAQTIHQRLGRTQFEKLLNEFPTYEKRRLRPGALAGYTDEGELVIKYAQSVEELLPLLRVPNVLVRSEAFQKLSKILQDKKELPETTAQRLFQELDFFTQRGTTTAALDAIEVLVKWKSKQFRQERIDLLLRLMKRLNEAPDAKKATGEFEQPLPLWTYAEKAFARVVWLLTKKATWLSNEDLKNMIQKATAPVQEYLWIVLAYWGDPEAHQQVRRLALKGSQNRIRWMAVEYLGRYGTAEDLQVLKTVCQKDPYWLDPRKYYLGDDFKHSSAAYFYWQKYSEPIPNRVYPIRDRAELAIQALKQRLEEEDLYRHSSSNYTEEKDRTQCL